MFAFECSLHALPDSDAPASGEPLTDSCGQWPTLLIAQDQLSTPLSIGFDDVLNQLGSLPRLYAEPDGSFVWTSHRKTCDGRSMEISMRGTTVFFSLN